MAIRRGIPAQELDPATEAFLFDRPSEGKSSFRRIRLENDLRGASLPAHDRALQAWQRHRETVLRAWMKAAPGTRPRCWWRYESPEPFRQVVRGCATRGQWSQPLRGIPRHLEDWSPELAHEAQATFLARHRLLTTAERKRMGPADYEPEPWRPDTGLVTHGASVARFVESPAEKRRARTMNNLGE